jgi:DNA-binding response OmpR family regulator
MIPPWTSPRVRPANDRKGVVSARILLVDDDPGVLDIVSYSLRGEGFEVDTVERGIDALETASREPHDLIILDLMLPDLSGTEVCRRLRAAQLTVPILMLTAKDAEVDRVLGLELGADDYVSKPFSKAELVSRVRAILRRREFDRGETSVAIREIGQLQLDFTRHEVVADGEFVRLTPSEFKLLAFLAEEPQRVFSRRQIMEHLWESSYIGDEHACDVHISNLRRKVERDAAHPERIVTVRGVGYKLVPV